MVNSERYRCARKPRHYNFTTMPVRRHQRTSGIRQTTGSRQRTAEPIAPCVIRNPTGRPCVSTTPPRISRCMAGMPRWPANHVIKAIFRTRCPLIAWDVTRMFTKAVSVQTVRNATMKADLKTSHPPSLPVIIAPVSHWWAGMRRCPAANVTGMPMVGNSKRCPPIASPVMPKTFLAPAIHSSTTASCTSTVTDVIHRSPGMWRDSKGTSAASPLGHSASMDR